MHKYIAVAFVTALSVGTIGAQPALAAARHDPARAGSAFDAAEAGQSAPGDSQHAAAQLAQAPHLFADTIAEAARELAGVATTQQGGGPTPGQGGSASATGLPIIQAPMSPDSAPPPSVAASTAAVPGPVIQTGVATWYGPGFVGSVTYCGDVFDQWAMTAASNTLPCGAQIVVTNQNTGGSVVVRINDRGGFGGPVILDLSQGAFDAVAGGSDGVIPVSVQLAQ
jgi:rare lipoprotein A